MKILSNLLIHVFINIFIHSNLVLYAMNFKFFHFKKQILLIKIKRKKLIRKINLKLSQLLIKPYYMFVC